MQLIKLAVVARARRRGGNFIEQPAGAALYVVRQLGLAGFGEVMVLDIHPVHEVGADPGKRVARTTVALGQLQDPQVLIHMVGGFDADVVAMQRIANRVAEPENARQSIRPEPDHQDDQHEADVADALAQRRSAHRCLSGSSAPSLPTTSTSKSVAAPSSRLVTSPLSQRRHNG